MTKKWSIHTSSHYGSDSVAVFLTFSSCCTAFAAFPLGRHFVVVARFFWIHYIFHLSYCMCVMISVNDDNLAACQVSYEEEVKKLKGKVAEFKRLTASSKSEAQPHTTVHSLQKELERRKVVYQTRLAELQQEVSRLKRGGNKMADLTNRQVDEAVLGKKDVMHEEEEGAVDVFRKELVVRKREYQTIRKERDSLYQQVEKLCDTVREAEKEIAHYKEKSQSDLDQKQVDVMQQENEVLKDQVHVKDLVIVVFVYCVQSVC